MTSKEQTGYEMECALSETLISEVRLTNEQLYYLIALAMNPCIDNPEKIRPIVLHELYAFLQTILVDKRIRFQPLMAARLAARWEAFKERTTPYLANATPSRAAASAARKEVHSSI